MREVAIETMRVLLSVFSGADADSYVPGYTRLPGRPRDYRDLVLRAIREIDAERRELEGRIAEMDARLKGLANCVKLVLETDALQSWACEAPEGEESILDSLRRAVEVKP